MIQKHKQECCMTTWEAKLRHCGANDPKPPRPVCDCGVDYENQLAENEHYKDALWSACTFIAQQSGTDPHEEFYGYLDNPPRKYGEPIEEA